jgi:hypothetical protein
MKYWYDKEFEGIICEPNCAEEWLGLICEVAMGYDGCYTVESLQGLVDELVDMSKKAYNCLYDGKIFEDKEYTCSSLKAAREERERCENG